MGIPYLTHSAVIKCSHGGTLQLFPPLKRSLYSGGSPILTDKDVLSGKIVGCPQPFKPCTSVLTIVTGLADKVVADDQIPVLMTLQAISDGGALCSPLIDPVTKLQTNGLFAFNASSVGFSLKTWLLRQWRDFVEMISEPGFWVGLAVAVVLGILAAILLPVLLAGATALATLAAAAFVAAVIGALAAAAATLVSNRYHGLPWSTGLLKAVGIGAGAAAFCALAGAALITFGGLAVGSTAFLVSMAAVGTVAGIGINLLQGKPWDKALLANMAISAVGSKLLEGCGDPIYPPSGEVCSLVTDFVLPGALEVRFERSYSSSLGGSDWLGPNWNCTWGRRVVRAGAYLVKYYPGDGRCIPFSLKGAKDEQGWLRNELAGKIRLRQTEAGFEVRNESNHIENFQISDRRSYLVSSIKDRNDNTLRFQYDDEGALQTVEHSGGYRLRVSGSSERIHRIELEDAEGKRHHLVSFTYDAAGCLTGVDNGSGKLFVYEYDPAARMTRWQDRNQTWTGYVYDDVGRCMESVGSNGMYRYAFQYDPAERSTKVTDSYGGIILVRYDDSNRVVSKRDQNGNVTITDYDSRGNKQAVTDGEGRTVRYEYDGEANLLASVAPGGERTEFVYNADSLLVAVKDPAGNVWVRNVDAWGNIVEAGLAGGKNWRYDYDRFGNNIAATDPEGHTRRYAYDAAGLLLSATDAAGHVTRLASDAFGRITQQIDALGNRTQFSYNALSKLEAVTRPDESQLRWDYDAEGNVLQRTGPDGAAFRYEYGPYDKLRTIQKPSGTKVSFHYDLEGRLADVKNELGESWGFEHDYAGNVVREKDFAGRVQTFRYDTSNLLIESTNGKGDIISIERDKNGRVSKRVSADGTATFGYGPNGFLKIARNDTIAVEFVRDAYGRVIREKQGNHVVESVFDSRGLRQSRRVDGEEIRWQYDPNGLWSGVSLPDDEQLLCFRDAAGREVERRLLPPEFGTSAAGQRSDGFVLRQGFNQLSQLTRQWWGSDSASIGERRYSYNRNGDPVQIEESRWGKSRFSYDLDGRLETADREQGISERFGYDAAGSIISVRRHQSEDLRDSSFSKSGLLQLRFVSEGGRLQKAGEWEFRLDGDGRTVEKREGPRVWRYEWNAEGQLRVLVRPDGVRWTYTYDALGRRVRKTGPDGTTSFVWDGALLAGELNEKQTMSSAWLFEPGTFRPMAKVQNGRAYACLTDQVGTARDLITSRAEVVWTGNFRAFGETEDEHADESGCALRFQGQWLDAESGLHYNFHRYYDPEIGQYLSPDPIGLAGGTRSYGYVHNPLSWVDPLGLAGCDVQFGQKRIDPTFSDNPKTPGHLRARPISDVAADLRAGHLTPDQLPIEAYRNEAGQLVTLNNRSLAALSEAGMKPSIITMREPSTLEIGRLSEQPLVDSPIPGPRIAVTPSRSDPTILRIIQLPGT